MILYCLLFRIREQSGTYQQCWNRELTQWHNYMESRTKTTLSEIEIVVDLCTLPSNKGLGDSITTNAVRNVIHNVAQKAASSSARYVILIDVVNVGDNETWTFDLPVPPTTNWAKIREGVERAVEDKRKDSTESLKAGRMSIW